ncbi:MAG TPA: archease [Candidatus Paceibacterota bacterium]|nr:archease [Candidatus Paceibacterota bacterium]
MSRFRIDVKNKSLKVFGNSLEDFFVNAGVGLSRVFYDNSEKFVKRARGWGKVKIEGDNVKSLLKKYLEKLIKISKKEKKVFPRIKVLRVSPKILEVQIFGVEVDEFGRVVERVKKIELNKNGKIEGGVSLDY